jgi:hypothetical protein
MSRRIPLLLVGLAVSLLASSVGMAARPGGADPADLSTKEGVAAYLTSKGLNASGFVVQRGPLNYAGPKCPGRKWKCTKKTKVVQVASGKHGRNKAECGPAGTLTQTAAAGTTTVTCIIVQNATSGKNKARCSLDARDLSPVVLECRITQTNVDDDNVAHVHERVSQRDGADQRATVNAQVTQTNGTGDNDSNVKQSIDQRSNEFSMANAPTQNQEGRFSGRIAQTSGSGSNDSRLIQNLDQTGRASGSSSIVQRQFGDHFGDVDQTITSVEGQSAAPVKSKSKGRKGSKSKSRSESAFSRSFARQTEDQRLRGPGEQTQIGPMHCCSTQLGGDPDKTQTRIRQFSRQEASQATAAQSLSLEGTCTTVGDCGIRHRGQNNKDSIRVLQRCVAPEGGTCSLFVPTTCGSEGCVSGGGGEGSSVVTKRRR